MRRYKLLRCGSPGIRYNSCYMFGVLAIVSKIEAKAYIAQCILRAARHWHKNQRQIILTERRAYQYMDYIRNLLQIKCCEPGKPNLYADVDLKLIFANKASRTVKYFYIYAVPFNRAWDVIQCNLRHYTQFAGKFNLRHYTQVCRANYRADSAGRRI